MGEVLDQGPQSRDCSDASRRARGTPRDGETAGEIAITAEDDGKSLRNHHGRRVGNLNRDNRGARDPTFRFCSN
jgi:hypothetical protein